MALIGLQGSRLAVISRIDGVLPAPELVLKLNQTVQRFSASLRGARFEREERERERQLREEQERDYQESLRADQEKERRVAEEQAAKERQIAEERRLEEERLRAEEEARQARERRAAQLPAEPAPTDKEITLIVFRLLDGSKIQRRFRESDPVQIMYDFIGTKEIGVRDFNICTNLPKIVYSDRNVTLKDAKLCPKALVIVEEAS